MQTNYQGVVFFDLDNTLLDDHSQVTAEVAAAIQQLRHNNLLPVINTGRAPREILETRQATGIDTFISLNGSYLEHEHQSVYQSPIATDLITGVVELANQLDDGVSFYTTSEIRTLKTDENVNSAYNLIHTEIPEVDPDFYQNNVILMLLLLNRHHDQAYAEKFPQFTYYRNSPYSIDTVLAGNSKMNGIKQLLHRLKLEDVPTYGFGDGPNDLSMLEFVDHAVAMGNGIPEAKAAAEFVTTANTDHGIVNGLRHFKLI
ncbi:Cof-type HAD-IIB family hydrolase [Lapidilactobacillus bayanensis]|uniref:Cof-type HAD-IIB family hydrolase n=1 Tax=Lapidilactobacillus bayanensis TaxID=2485998 RepID=UPI000F78FD48|nr:Cof-type HAD-IIB family hydrolase [Lapidilactobacillus bayanensis]